jgi:hypothetical protein
MRQPTPPPASMSWRPMSALPSSQLLLYRFASAAQYEGQLVGALERIESGGALVVVEALFVRRDAETGELDAVDVRGGRAGGLVAALLDFRLDEGQRRHATERALSGDRAAAVRELGSQLQPGEAMAVVLVEHVWERALEDAVARTGGVRVASEFVDGQAPPVSGPGAAPSLASRVRGAS